LPIGTVQSYEPKAQPLPEAIIQLNAQISQLEWVSVIPLVAPGQPLTSVGADEPSPKPAPANPAPANPAPANPAVTPPKPVESPIQTGAQ
jgi:hypothetical protein